MILQLSPSIPVVTPKGSGEAILVIDNSKEDHLQWVVIQDDGGEIWTFQNPQVRGQKNITMGRMNITPIATSNSTPDSSSPLPESK
jgi:hypothetical protein